MKRVCTPFHNHLPSSEAGIMTGHALQYEGKLDHFGEHGVVDHSAKEYGRADVHANTSRDNANVEDFRKSGGGLTTRRSTELTTRQLRRQPSCGDR